MKTTFNLDRALAATRRALRKLVASLAAQIVAPAPPSTLKPFRPSTSGRRVPPLQPSNPSTLQLWNIVNLRPEYPCVFFRSWIADEVYVAHMAVACHYASWNSRNPCPN